MLSVEHLSVSFRTRLGITRAVDDLGFTVAAGGITALIGESGSGKSVACLSLLGLVPRPPGHIDGGRALLNGRDLLSLSERELRAVRGSDIAMVFQDPMTCLNPYLTIGRQLAEPLRLHQRVSAGAARTRAIELLNEVGIRDPATALDAFPHQFSGGMRQRVMIAMALINEPKLLIADEPTTALDVTVQAQILQLLDQLRARHGLGILFISHDLAVVSDIADDIVVMKDGRAVERGDRDAIFTRAEHPYTRQLLEAIPRGRVASAATPAVTAPAARAASDAASPASAGSTVAATPLLSARALRVEFRAGARAVTALDGVSLDIARGEVLGVVGESGSGKSTLGRALTRLQPLHAGSVHFDGMELTALAPRPLRALRRRMQFIFQDPFASLNPRMSVYDTLAEPLLLHGLAERRTLASAVLSLMDDVGLARAGARKYPHEFSGGQRQRIAIGRALATRPEFVVADEPVSALDVTIQAQILRLLAELRGAYGLTMLFITHDLAVVRAVADRIAVMRAGKIVEQAPAEALFSAPRERYTQELMQAIPGRFL